MVTIVAVAIAMEEMVEEEEGPIIQEPVKITKQV